jgi:hypothetical protein
VLVAAENVALVFVVLFHEWTGGIEQFSQAGGVGIRLTLFLVMTLNQWVFLLKKVVLLLQ